nr:sensor histidine kinase [Kineococcus vitellinus]
MLAALLAVPGLVCVLLLLAGVVLSVTLLGLPVVALALTCARGLGRVHRALARRLLGVAVEEPQPRPRGASPVGGMWAVLSDATAWRTVGFLLVQAPLAFVGVYAPAALVAALAATAQGWATGREDAAPGLLPLLVLIAFLGPWLLRATALLDGLVVRAMIGPDPLTTDAARLRRSRSAALEGSAAEVRAIERDLHDGTQARLTAIALHVDMARGQLRGPGGPGRAAELLDVAHATTTEAITELRTIVRRIHPPALDDGLGPALVSLAEQSALPVRTELALAGARLSPAIETMAYFCVTELVANATRHAGAGEVLVRVTARRRRLRVLVRDDGRGGADPSRGSGLRGLADRVATVDGTVRVQSPPGAGTSVRVELPLRA